MNWVSELFISLAYFGVGFVVGAIYVHVTNAKQRTRVMPTEIALPQQQSFNEEPDVLRKKLLKSMDEIAIENFVPRKRIKE